MTGQSTIQNILQAYTDKVGEETSNLVTSEVDHKDYHDYGRLELLSCYLIAGRNLAPLLTVEYPKGGSYPTVIRVPALNEIYFAYSEQEYRGCLDTVFSDPKIKELIDKMKA